MVFLIDNSACMSRHMLSTIRSELDDACKALMASDQIAVLSFGAGGTEWVLTPRPARDPKSHEVVSLLDGSNYWSLCRGYGFSEKISPREPVALTNALYLALQQPFGRGTDLVVVTAEGHPDHDDNIPYLQHQLARRKIQLHLLHIGSPHCDAYQQLCSLVGFYVRIDESELKATFQSIVSRSSCD